MARAGEREWDKGAKEFCPGWWLQPGQKAAWASNRGPFVPVGDTNRDKWPPFCLGWCLQPGQNSLAPISPSLSPRPSHSAHLFLVFLARERGVLAHFFTTFVKIFDSRPSIGAKGLGLVFLFFLGLYSSFYALEIEKMCS